MNVYSHPLINFTVLYQYLLHRVMVLIGFFQFFNTLSTTLQLYWVYIMDISDISLKYTQRWCKQNEGVPRLWWRKTKGHTLIINTYKAILPILTQHEMRSTLSSRCRQFPISHHVLEKISTKDWDTKTWKILLPKINLFVYKS